ncbi:MAG TPA: 2-oxoacid:acceptor oxidoreductase family protein, partial [Opitutales bacterium]|nr:2-oxoacid:acceptor oxidoreductase family protein [Opitutales bacterium]
MSKKQEITIRLAGYSQDGIQSMGSLLAKLAGRSGYRVMTYMTIPATVAGGNSIYQLRIGNRSILTPGDEADVLVALYQDSLEAHISLLKAGGVLLCDSKHCQPEGKVPDGTHVYALPITDLLESALGGHAMKGKNMFLLGMLSRLLGLDDAKVEDLALERFRKKDESVIQNVRTALMAGLEYEWSGRRPDIHLDEAKHSCEAVTMDGNSAVAYGLISAGVRYGASYPITPATSIMEVLIEELPKYNGVFLQTEDELAAAAAAIGMSS